jgi:hypothetical protein
MSSYRICYGTAEAALRLAKVWFGSDGSYYVAMPVPMKDRAVLAKFTVNYATDARFMPFSEAVDLAEAKRADKEIKFTHHPDGFIQFSGANVVSGKDEDGGIRGVGTMSWPLWDPVRGPAFGLGITRPYDLLGQVKPRASDLVIAPEAVAAVPDWDQLVLEGYYFPALWRRFVRYRGGAPYLSVFHPCKAMLELRVLFPRGTEAVDGFLGIEVYTSYASADADDPAPPGFIFGGPSGDARTTDSGEMEADAIYCFYPSDGIPAHRSIDRIADYMMLEVPRGLRDIDGQPRNPWERTDEPNRPL